MQITIVTDDKIVLCDGVLVALPNIDWAKFAGDPATPYDDIAAVQFNTGSGQGHIEYKTVVTKQTHRPNMRPPDCPITAEDFERDFAWILPFYRARKAEIEAEAAAAAKAAQEARDDAEAKSAGDRAARTPGHSADTDAAPFDDVLAKLAAIEAENAALKARVASHDAAFDNIANVKPPA